MQSRLTCSCCMTERTAVISILRSCGSQRQKASCYPSSDSCSETKHRCRIQTNACTPQKDRLLHVRLGLAQSACNSRAATDPQAASSRTLAACCLSYLQLGDPRALGASFQRGHPASWPPQPPRESEPRHLTEACLSRRARCAPARGHEDTECLCRGADHGLPHLVYSGTHNK